MRTLYVARLGRAAMPSVQGWPNPSRLARRVSLGARLRSPPAWSRPTGRADLEGPTGVRMAGSTLTEVAGMIENKAATAAASAPVRARQQPSLTRAFWREPLVDRALGVVWACLWAVRLCRDMGGSSAFCYMGGVGGHKLQRAGPPATIRIRTKSELTHPTSHLRPAEGQPSPLCSARSSGAPCRRMSAICSTRARVMPVRCSTASG